MTHKIFIIEAHKNPTQLKRMINRLNDEQSSFYIHIDKKSDIQPFKATIEGKNIKFLERRVDCIWCDISQVEATILLIEEVLRDKHEGMVILLSGQDYPIKSKREINNFLDKNSQYNFIDAVPVQEAWKYSWREKVENYRFNFSSERGASISLRKISKQSLKAFFKGIISLKQLLLLLKQRKLNLSITQYGGSTWWAINTNSLKKMYAYVKQNEKELFSYFKYTHCPDEIMFQSIMKYLSQTDNFVKIFPSLTYVNWERFEMASSPVTFGMNDLPELLSQPESKLFARKFDMETDSDILDLLDEKCASVFTLHDA
ncbi:MAG: beta-1,6-N-acetylglucosaminyltransferase [Prevotellaceae bacterium]|jgi:hypothetical protein|nr:beta-1,6-N-acetylglucosaminyltransferase [Prevotellaceae bacterium]